MNTDDQPPSPDTVAPTTVKASTAGGTEKASDDKSWTFMSFLKLAGWVLLLAFIMMVMGNYHADRMTKNDDVKKRCPAQHISMRLSVGKPHLPVLSCDVRMSNARRAKTIEEIRATAAQADEPGQAMTHPEPAPDTDGPRP